ncbi:MAG: hypothetical protein KIT19_13775 [Phycisphaeraceae bacterium]|nr:hypothetical protein [Phycisphaeraceae bacterium]
MSADDLRARLCHADASVRRIALRDLLGSGSAPTPNVLERVALSIGAAPEGEAELALRVIARWAYLPARGVVETVMMNPKSPARVAHEARIALDRIDLVAMGKIPSPLA